MRRRIIVGMACIILCVGFIACDTSNNAENPNNSIGEVAAQNNSNIIPGYTDIKPEEAKKRLDSEKGIILLDVRTQEEYSGKHIPNSILIPVEVIQEEAPSKLTDKNATIFVYCRSGRRSEAAADALAKMGYTKVYDLGGIIDWPYETESDQ